MIVFDLDRTLRDTSCSDHLIPSDKTHTKHWVPWQKHVVETGEPLPFCKVYKTMASDAMIVTSSQFGTKEWLNRHDLPLPAHGIIERDIDDHRHPLLFKKAFLEDNYRQLYMWVDDDPDICDLVAQYGVITMLLPGGHKPGLVEHTLHTHQDDITIGLRGASVLVEVSGRRFHWPHEFTSVGDTPAPTSGERILYQTRDGRLATSVSCHCDWRERGEPYDIIKFIVL